MKPEQIKTKIVTFMRSGHAADMVINLVGPWLVYSWAEPSLGRVHALMASAIPPIIWSVIQLIRNRRLDALSMIVLGGIALSLLAFFGGGGYRMLQLREHLLPAVTAFVFIGSVAIKRPLFVAVARSVARRMSHEKAEELERKLKKEYVVRLLTRLTLAIGFVLILQVVIAVILVFTIPVKEFLIVSPIINYTMAGLLVAGLLYLKPKMTAAVKDSEQAEPEAGR
ncbi:MAG: VC0807 family protein [Gammaproteobacteria bacterium]